MAAARWIPYIANVEQTKNSGGVLMHKAIRLLNQQTDEEILFVLRDSYGTFGFETNSYIVSAKEYPYGYIVSCHEDLVLRAKEKNKKVALFINQSERFYLFKWQDIVQHSTANYKGQAKMLNFDIKLGKNIDDKPEETQSKLV